MNAPIATCLFAGCLFIGGLTGAADKIGGDVYYENFIQDPSSYYLVDDLGRPVSQEPK